MSLHHHKINIKYIYTNVKNNTQTPAPYLYSKLEIFVVVHIKMLSLVGVNLQNKQNGTIILSNLKSRSSLIPTDIFIEVWIN